MELDAVGRDGSLGVAVAGGMATLSQALLLREALASLRGDELGAAIGAVAWLLGGAIGALTGTLLARRVARPSAWIWGLSLTGAVATLASLIAMRLLPVLLGLQTGEEAAGWSAPLAAASLLIPSAMVLAATFPLACAAKGITVARVVALEALGAALAGILYTVWIGATVDGLSASAGMVALLLLALGARDRWAWGWAAAGLAAAGLSLAAAGPASLALAARSVAGLEVSRLRPSPRGCLLVASQRGQVSIFENGILLGTLPDLDAEIPVDLGLVAVNGARRILLIGGLPVGGAPAALAFPVDRVDVVVDSAEVLQIIQDSADESLRSALRDPRLRLTVCDPRVFVRECEPYDVVIATFPAPSTLSASRFHSSEFFCALRRALRPAGALVFELPEEPRYLGDEASNLLGSIWRSLRVSFPDTHLVPLRRLFAVAGAGVPTAETMRRRLDGVTPLLFYPEDVTQAVDLRQAELEAALAQTRVGENRDLLPVACFWHRRWADRMQGRHAAGDRAAEGDLSQGAIDPSQAADNRPESLWPLWLGSALLLCIGLRRLPPSGAAAVAVGLGGAAAMAFQVCSVVVHQARVGALPAEIGLLIGLFMLGVGGASLLVERRRPGLPAGLGLLAAACLGLTASGMDSPIVARVWIWLLSIVAGAGAGVLLPAACTAVDEGAAGRLYAVDLLGACSGTLVALWLVPAWGADTVSLGLGMVLLVASRLYASAIDVDVL